MSPRAAVPSLTALLGLFVLIPDAGAVSRQAAATTVINTVISPHPRAFILAAYGPQLPVQAGETVLDGFDGRIAAVAPNTSWLFWLDLDPEAEFAHETEYVLVDTLLGTITVHVDGEFWPYFAGLDFYRDELDRTSGNPDRIYAGPFTPAPEASGARLLFETRPALLGVPDPTAGKWALIISGEDTLRSPARQSDVDSARTVFGQVLGVPTGNMTILNRPSKQALCDSMEAMAQRCPKFYVFFTGHGRRGRFFTGRDSVTAAEFASKLKALNAGEYCTFMTQCYSGSFLPVFRDSGLRGLHTSGTSAETTSYRRDAPNAKFAWRGNVYAHYILLCLRQGLTGQAAFRCARDSVAAYVVRRNKQGASQHPQTPQSSQAFVDTTGAQQTVIDAPAGTGTVCIMWKPGPPEACANATLYCQVVVGPGDTTWRAVKHWNWNNGQTRYFRPYGAPGATGKYRLVSHANRYPVCGEITFTDQLLGETASSTFIFPAYSVGWNDRASEFALVPVPGFVSFGPGLTLNQVPTQIGTTFTGTSFLDVGFNLQADPSRPWLYYNGDPLQGFYGNTVAQVFAEGIFDPNGFPVPFLPIRVEFYQGLQYRDFQTFAQAGIDGIVIPPVDLGPILPVPFRVHLSVPGGEPGEASGPGAGYFTLDAFAVLSQTFGSLGIGDPPMATGIELSTPWPNPSEGNTRVRLALPAAGRVRIEVFDLGGRRLRSLFDGVVEAGLRAFSWDGRTDDGTRVPSGIYFMSADVDGVRKSRRVIRAR